MPNKTVSILDEDAGEAIDIGFLDDFGNLIITDKDHIENVIFSGESECSLLTRIELLEKRMEVLEKK